MTRPYRAAVLAAFAAFLMTSTTTLGAAPAAFEQVQGNSIYIPQDEFEALASGGAKIVDLRPAAEYAVSHLPGAINIPRYTLNNLQVEGIATELRPNDELEAIFAAAGLSYDDTILLYDAQTLAGRGFLALDHAGFKNLHVLDGGINAWTGELSAEAVVPTPSDFKLTDAKVNIVSRDYVLQRVGSPDIVILDSRGAESFNDGHIPGSLNLPNAQLLVDGALRPAGELLAELAAIGVTPDKEIITTCGNGGAASHQLALLRNLGFTKIALYDGSWNDWISDPAAPREVIAANYHFSSDFNDENSLGPTFLSADDVKAALADPDSVVVDIRDQSLFNFSEHIKGSVNVPWTATLGENGGLLDRDALTAVFAEAGVTPDKRVVIFSTGGLQTSHAFTVLSLLGFENVDVYSGGWDDWFNPAFPADQQT